MNIIVPILIVGAVLGNVHGVQKCITSSSDLCLPKSSTESVIEVDNHTPRNNCLSVSFDNSTYIYDKVNITKVWITINNTKMNCDNNSMTQMTRKLSLTNGEEVLFIEVQEAYLRMIFVIRNGSSIKAITFTQNFEQKLRIANFVLYPLDTNLDIFGQFCMNGGQVNLNYKGAGYRCICPKNSISFGPRCEYMDRVLNSSIYYFNAFRDEKRIQITFSLYSNGVKKNQSLLMIKNSTFQKLVEISVKESRIYLITENSSNYKVLPIDKQMWNDFYLEVTTTGVLFRVSNIIMNDTFRNEVKETFLSHYLVLREDNANEFNFCIRNLKFNSQIIDLNNGDGYESCCLDRCITCTEYQDCACFPFISMANTECYCKIGYDTTNEGCVPTNLKYSEINATKTASYNETRDLSSVLSRIDFKFRTLSTNGTLMTLFLSSPSVNITTQIVKTQLTLIMNNMTLLPINYNVSDGNFHSVTLHTKIITLEMILDDNANFSVAISNWMYTTDGIKLSSFKLGPMYKPFDSTINPLTTCFSAIRVNGVSKVQNDINLTTNNNVLSQCSNGLNCSSNLLNCTDNRVCNDSEWQNTKCVCRPNFVWKDSVCIYSKCSPNPCQNNGVCLFNESTTNYFCTCKSDYTGPQCETFIATAAGLWWIAILVVLLLLLIILIVLLIYCCCCRNRHKPDSPSINKIHENTVIYNEQAGECDYNGPPINYDLMKKALYNQGVLPKAQINPAPDLINKKLELDKYNNDLILDHPLEYGYEGYNSEAESVSSLGSDSTNSQLNTLPLDNTGTRFNYLTDLYK